MDVKKLFKQYSLNTYTRSGPVFVKGRGSWLWDDCGRRYLDLFPGWGVSILGHSHPRLAKVIGWQAKRLIHLPNNLFFREQALLARDIVKKSFPAKIFFGNSGAEAVEGAIKLSRLYGKGKRFEVITMKDSFHGRTFAALSATGQKKYKYSFRPIVPGFKETAFNDLTAIKKKCTAKTVAVLLELIQGEGGINVANVGYVQALAGLCRKNNMLLIVDEVQTGMGRTGSLFCFQQYGIKPDIMLLSKGLGAGVPISAIVVNKRIAEVIQPGMHASTFGGSPLVTAAAREVFTIIETERLLENVSRQGAYLYEALCAFQKKYSFVREIRGKGLMLGVELDGPSQPVFQAALLRGLLVNATQGNIVRIMPALNVTRQEIEYGLEILDEVFANYKG